MHQCLWHIRDCPIFEQLEPSQWEELERGARIRNFPKGSCVYVPSDASLHLLFLHKGRVRLSDTTPDGKLAVLGFIEPGELFGELALVDRGRREERAEAVKDSTIVVLSGESVVRLMQHVTSLTLQMTQLIGQRRKRLERRLKSLLFRSNRDRLIMLLIDLVEQYRAPPTPAGEIRIGLKLSHQDLAALIGATRESVTILLGGLQLEGFIRHGRQQIVICDFQRLCNEVKHFCELDHSVCFEDDNQGDPSLRICSAAIGSPL